MPFYIGLWAIFKNPHDFLPGGYLYLALTFVVCCGGTVFFSLKSFWAYGEKGIEVFDFFGKCIKKYEWKDVAQVGKFTVNNRALSWVFLEMNDDRQFIIWVFTTRNYLGILTDIVKFVQKNNSDTSINSSVLELVQKKSWFLFF